MRTDDFDVPALAPLPDTESAHVAEAERLLRLGEPLLAYNVAETGLGYWPGSLRLKQLLGRALTRSSDLERAHRVLAELAAAGVDDAETIGVLARIHVDEVLLADLDPPQTALAAATGASGIDMRDVGTIPLAKRSGSQALYRLHLAE